MRKKSTIPTAPKKAISKAKEQLKEIEKEKRAIDKKKEDAQKLVFCKWLFDTHGLKCVPEYKFHPTRKWRIDYYFEGKVKVGLEVEGKIFGGRHTNPLGFIADMEKYNTFSYMGIYLVRCQTKELNINTFHIDPELLDGLKKILL